MKATLNFPTPETAQDFASAWSRHTLIGYSIKGCAVDLDSINDERKAWVDNYVAEMNKKLDA